MSRVIKLLLWIFGVIVALPILFYVVVVVINRHDAEPSATAVEFNELLLNRHPVADADNAYIYVMGFEVAPEGDPVAMGKKRIAWIDASVKTDVFDQSADPSHAVPDYRITGKDRHDEDRDFYRSCTGSNKNCSESFGRPTREFEALLAKDAWLLQRYQTLLNYRGWFETADRNFDSPLIPLSMPVNGQKLYLAKAMLAARMGDAATVRDMLTRDLRFWRNVLACSDEALSKTIATSAVERHFEAGNLILRALPPDAAVRAMPVEWRSEISDDERSMARSLVGEWQNWASSVRFISRAIQKGKPAANIYDDDTRDNSLKSTVGKKFVSLVGAPFLQPQDTINKYASDIVPAIELSKMPFEQLEQASIRASIMRKPKAKEGFYIPSLYNAVGQWLYETNDVNFVQYSVRVADIEGVRRAALLAVTLRDSGIRESTVAKALTTNSLRDPYRDKPFAWDNEAKAIVFRGLEPGERGMFRITY